MLICKQVVNATLLIHLANLAVNVSDKLLSSSTFHDNRSAWNAIYALTIHCRLVGDLTIVRQKHLVIAKSYLMIGAEVRSEQALQQLDQSVARFENNYQALAEYAPSAEIGIPEGVAA